MYFIYRYIIRLGFLDGKLELVFSILHSFWFRFIIDAKVFEVRNLAEQDAKSINKVINKLYGINIDKVNEK